jgi:hypothetical protein
LPAVAAVHESHALTAKAKESVMPEGSGKNSGLSLSTVLVLLAFFGVGAPLMISTAHQASSTTNSIAKVKNEASNETTAVGLLDEFFDVNPDQFIETDPPWYDDSQIYPQDGQSWSNRDPRSYDKISFLIATLPNPEDPSLRYEFDRYIDSIQRAMNGESYLLDKTYLPWFAQLDNQASPGANRPKLYRHPGLMLFRRFDAAINKPSDNHPERESLMVVFLVGETPTDGVDATAFRSALDQVAWLRGWIGTGVTAAPSALLELSHDPPDELKDKIKSQIKIIGPSYSGSATSIQEVLRSWLNHTAFNQTAFNPPTVPHISLLSGTATAIEDWPPELGDFRSTELPEAETDSSIFNFFKHEMNDPSIAMLTDDTGYGNEIRHNVSNGVTILPYPVHISEVRTAFESFRTTQASPATTPPGYDHRDPSISDEDPGPDRYLVPSFSRASAADDEVVLANLLSTIHREDFHYVGIVASDIRDAIFLIHEIRDNCPDTVPFLTSSDLLYLHSDFNHDLAGTLVFSTYPLFSPNQLWTDATSPDHRWRFNQRQSQFPSGESEGLYNAVLAALNDPARMVEYTVPFSSAFDEPPIWVSVVGHDELWPVYVYPSEFDGLMGMSNGEFALPFWDASARPSPWIEVFDNDRLWPVSPYPSQPSTLVFARPFSSASTGFLPSYYGTSLYPRPFWITFVLVIILCPTPTLYLVARRVRGKGAQASWPYRMLSRIASTTPRWLARVIGEPANPATVNPTDHRLSLLSFILVLLTFFIVATAVWVLPLRAMSLWKATDSRFGDNFALLALALGPTLIPGLLILLSLAWLFRDMVTEAGQIHSQFPRPTLRFLFNGASWTARLTFFFTLAATFLALLLAKSICSQTPLQALLYFVRAANLWNGVSPLLPVLFIGIAALWLSVSELWRLRLSEEHVLITDFLGFGDSASFAGIGANARDAVVLLKCTTDNLPLWLLWIAMPFAIYLMADAPGFKLVALDGPKFNLLVVVFAIFVYTSFLLLFVRFVTVWLKLRSLLYRLYMHPTRRSYEELRTGSAAPSMADRNRIWLIEPAESVTAVEFCLERVREMLRKVEPHANSRSAAAPAIGAETIADRVWAARVALWDLAAAVQPYLDSYSHCAAAGEWQAAIKWKSWLQSAMSDLSRCVTEVFEPWWRLDRKSSLTAATPGDQHDLEESLIKSAELFVASRVVDFLRQVFPQLMNMVVFASVGLLAMMLALSSYPFPQRDTVAWLSWIILLSVIAITFVIFIQINRDRVVSMLLGTTPGQLSWDSSFIWQVVIFGLVPILTLLGAQFPNALQGVFSSVGGIFASSH